MGNLIKFWRKDIINKLIVVVGLVIVLTLGIQIYILTATPGGEAFMARFRPTQTLSVDQIFRLGEQTATAEAASTSRAFIPTITTMPMTPRVISPSGTPTASVTAAAQATQTPTTAATSTPTTAPSSTLAAGPSVTPTSKPVSASGSCPSRKNEQVGKVLEVIDGNTVRVLINDLVYVVRYIGVDVPKDPNFTDLSRFINGELVYAKEIKLYSEGTDADENNRLLRYVVVNDSTLVNQELIRRGLATAATSSYVCAADFQAAEQAAKTDRSGLWQVSQP
jgi:endonuclease YncB( thermonuclease family)